MRLTVGTEVVKRHIFKATLQHWGMMSGWVCKCKLLCTVNVECERMAGQRTNNNHSHNDATIKSIRLVHSHSALYFSCTVTKKCATPPSAELPSSGDRFNHNMLLQRPRAALPAQMVWISGHQPSWCAPHPTAINHRQIQSSEKVISPRMVAQKQKPNFRSRPRQGSSATFMFIEPQWIHYLFGTISLG